MKVRFFALLLLSILFTCGCTDYGFTDYNRIFRQECKKGNVAEVKRLITSGKIDINKMADISGPTPLMWASSYGQLEVVKILIENGADVNMKDGANWTALTCSAKKGYDSVVKFLLEHGAETDNKESPGYTALSLASIHGYEKTVEVLLQYKANVNIPDNEGRTALDKAVERNHKRIIELLKEHGAKTGAELKAEKPVPTQAPDDKMK